MMLEYLERTVSNGCVFTRVRRVLSLGHELGFIGVLFPLLASFLSYSNQNRQHTERMMLKTFLRDNHRFRSAAFGRTTCACPFCS